MKNLFYSTIIHDNSIDLEEQEAIHAYKVLRLKNGDTIHVTTGEGTLYTCSINDISKNKLSASIESSVFIENTNLKINLAISPTKNSERIEWMVEKLVEIGIHSITPVICKHSERKSIKTDRLNKIAVSAMKQSQQYWLPKINEAVEFDKFIIHNNSNCNLIAHCRNDSIPFINSMVQPEKETTILIGPEGDFSEKEIELAVKNNWKEISLGKNKLRTETAGLFAITSIYSKYY